MLAAQENWEFIISSAACYTFQRKQAFKRWSSMSNMSDIHQCPRQCMMAKWQWLEISLSKDQRNIAQSPAVLKRSGLSLDRIEPQPTIWNYIKPIKSSAWEQRWFWHAACASLSCRIEAIGRRESNLEAFWKPSSDFPTLMSTSVWCDTKKIKLLTWICCPAIVMR